MAIRRGSGRPFSLLFQLDPLLGGVAEEYGAVGGFLHEEIPVVFVVSVSDIRERSWKRIIFHRN